MIYTKLCGAQRILFAAGQGMIFGPKPNRFLCFELDTFHVVNTCGLCALIYMWIVLDRSISKHSTHEFAVHHHIGVSSLMQVLAAGTLTVGEKSWSLGHCRLNQVRNCLCEIRDTSSQSEHNPSTFISNVLDNRTAASSPGAPSYLQTWDLLQRMEYPSMLFEVRWRWAT